MYIEQLYTHCLAEAAYYVESAGEAAIIDPLRETSPYTALAEKRGAKIKYVLETHFHADFVSGHIDLARETNSIIVYGPGAETSYKVHNAYDGEILSLGDVSFKVLHTPGHTPESCCYLLLDESKKPQAIFTGDTLFVGDVGRPDLLEGTLSQEDLASMMFDSLNNKIKVLPDEVVVYPGHGPGSACGKNIGKETFSTIGEQKKFNYALKATDRETFIRELTDGISAPPAYFFEDVKINRSGYEPIEAVIRENKKPLSQKAFELAVKNGALMLDTRNPDSFEKGHIPNALNIGLDGQYAVWVGTLIDIRQPLVLICETGKEEESVIRLARVGYENVVGYLEGGMKKWIGEPEFVRSISASALRAKMDDGAEVIDVRKPGEWSVSHLKEAKFFPLADMPSNLRHLKKDASYIVHCGGGYRSMIAISLMKRQGFTNLINVYGGFKAMQDAGLKIAGESVSV